MEQKLNFLYCFDNNYNNQALTSIISLLDNSSEKINLHIIHSDSDFVKVIPENIFQHIRLNNLNLYTFEDYDHHFPNLDNVHISVATYFRLFIENYLPSNISNFIFLDADTICNKDPVEILIKKISLLNNSVHTIAARTEHEYKENSENKIFERLQMNGHYFNAGVMIIDFNKWRKNNVQEDLIIKLKALNNKILQWDQDVLNSLFNGQYLELDKNFNFNPNELERKSKINNKILFLHFLGSKKPWLTSGVFNKQSEIYHSNYRKIFSNQYHITHKWKTRSLIDFFKSCLKFKIFNLKFPLVYTKELFKSFVKD